MLYELYNTALEQVSQDQQNISEDEAGERNEAFCLAQSPLRWTRYQMNGRDRCIRIVAELRRLRELLGFDRTEYDWSKETYRMGCSQCDTLVIQGVPCHERGCPNYRKDEEEDHDCDVGD